MLVQVVIFVLIEAGKTKLFIIAFGMHGLAYNLAAFLTNVLLLACFHCDEVSVFVNSVNSCVGACVFVGVRTVAGDNSIKFVLSNLFAVKHKYDD